MISVETRSASMRNLLPMWILLMVMGILWSIGNQDALALQQTDATPELQLTIAVTEEEEVLLEAQLTDSEGKAIGGKWVLFYMISEFFGEQEVYLGRGFSDRVGGFARLRYEPRVDGMHRFRAIYEGNGGLKVKADASAELFHPLEVEDSPEIALEWLKRPVSSGALLLTLATWFTMLGVLIRTIVTIRGEAANDFELKQENLEEET